MIPEIKSIEDVRTFFNQLHQEELNFHPDEDFCNYVNIKTGEPSYSAEEIAIRNNLLDQCFEICEKSGADIYELAIEIFMKDFYAAYPQE